MTPTRNPIKIDGPVAVPPMLYKYASWRNAYHKRLITHREIFFASAKRFNDPFDSAIVLRYDMMTPEYELDLLMRNIPREFPHARPEEVAQLAKERLRDNWLRESKNSEEVRSLQLRLTYETIGLFSVTEVPNSILMWSYYADSHSGFCLGYDAEALAELLAQIGDSSPLLFDQRAVQYSEYPFLIPSRLSNEDFVLKRTHTKALDWRHEKEWRFVVVGTTDLPLPLPTGIVKQLILGCRTCEEHKNEILSFARKTLGPSVTCWQIKTKDAEFSLELAPLT